MLKNFYIKTTFPMNLESKKTAHLTFKSQNIQLKIKINLFISKSSYIEQFRPIYHQVNTTNPNRGIKFKIQRTIHHTWSRGYRRVKKRNTCINQKRVSWYKLTANKVKKLVKTEPINERKKLCTLVEQNFEENRDSPHDQSRHEEEKSTCCVLFLSTTMIVGHGDWRNKRWRFDWFLLLTVWCDELIWHGVDVAYLKPHLLWDLLWVLTLLPSSLLSYFGKPVFLYVKSWKTWVDQDYCG